MNVSSLYASTLVSIMSLKCVDKIQVGHTEIIQTKRYDLVPRETNLLLMKCALNPDHSSYIILRVSYIKLRVSRIVLRASYIASL